MTAAVAPPPQVLDSSALARKRRREILSSQRVSVLPDPSPSSANVSSERSSSFEEPPRVKRKVSEEFCKTESDEPAKPKKVQKAKSGSKKPQMKYDPDVPMTKEEAAAWRREQRRKRNRESAAASRQRQRDRISELEVEVEEWKKKFNEAMEKLRKLEAQTDLPSELLSTGPQEIAEKSIVSPSSTPNASPRASPTVSPIASCSHNTGRLSLAVEGQQHQISDEEGEKQHLINMISLPA